MTQLQLSVEDCLPGGLWIGGSYPPFMPLPPPFLAGAKYPAGKYLDGRFGGRNGRNPVAKTGVFFATGRKTGVFFCDQTKAP